MRIKETYIILLGLIILVSVYTITSLSIAESFIIGLQAYFLFRLVNNLGYTICFFDFLCFYSVLDTLLMPFMGYRLYDKTYTLSRVVGWYMRVPEDTYYSYLIPANIAFFLGINFLIRKFDAPFYKNLITRLGHYAKDKGNIGIVMTVCGFICSFFNTYLTFLGFVGYLIAMLRYVGPIYIYFSDSPIRKRAIIIAMLLFLIEAVFKAMFGEFLMYFILLLIIVTIRFNLKFYTKLSVFLFGIILVFTLQSIKNTFRIITWKGRTVEGLSLKTSSQLEVFGTLFYNRFTDVEKIFNRKSFFPIYTRMNQGYLISRAMDYVPRVEPYAEGETIAWTIAAILVPRYIWPDKPEVGGYENLSRFLGLKKKLNYSMDIGPYGEAYGNFGPAYGVAFMFLYGMLLSYFFKVSLIKAVKRPTLLLWTPILFFSTLTMETNFLSTINAFIKTAVFMYILFWLVRKVFKVSL